MKTSENGIALMKRFEGCGLTAYKDRVGVWTIGYGITNADKSITGRTIRKGMKISRETADAWLRKSLRQKYEPKVAKYADQYHWNQNQYDALVSFAFNIGSIDQLTANGKRTIKQIANAMLLYDHAGGRRVKGLTERRRAEQRLFLTPVGNKSDHIGDATKMITRKRTVTNAAGANLRELPSGESAVVATVKQGAELAVVEDWTATNTAGSDTRYVCVNYAGKWLWCAERLLE